MANKYMLVYDAPQQTLLASCDIQSQFFSGLRFIYSSVPVDFDPATVKEYIEGYKERKVQGKR